MAIRLAGVYERQVGGEIEQVTQEAFKNDEVYFSELDRILDELFEDAEERGLSWSQLADKAGLCAQTVKNLGERWTKRPQYRTVMLIALALDCVIQLNVISKKSSPSLRIAKAG